MLMKHLIISKAFQATWEKIMPSIHTPEIKKCIYQNAHQIVYQNTDIKMPIKMYIKYTFRTLTVQIYIHLASNIHSHQIYIKMPIKMYIKYH
jgi:hypothetical protein